MKSGIDQKPVLYFGDTSLASNASYLAGLMTAFGIGYDYVASDESPEGSLLAMPRKLFVFSDYPARMISHEAQVKIVEQVREGAGLLMIGGWESFCGSDGGWHNTPIDQALPVDVPSEDDRVNSDRPAFVRVAAGGEDHPVVEGLPWDERPPYVGGYNRLTPSKDTRVILEATRCEATRKAEGIVCAAGETVPLLVVGRFVRGHTAALATDVAPHWVGGLVDWGKHRVSAKPKGGWEIEVGSDYAELVHQLLTWTGRLDREGRAVAD